MKVLKINSNLRNRISLFNKYFNLLVFKVGDILNLRVSYKDLGLSIDYESFNFYDYFVCDIEMITESIELFNKLKRNILALHFYYDILIIGEDDNLKFYIFRTTTDIKVVLYKDNFTVYSNVYPVETNMVNEINKLIANYK